MVKGHQLENRARCNNPQLTISANKAKLVKATGTVSSCPRTLVNRRKAMKITTSGVNDQITCNPRRGGVSPH